MGIIDKVKKNRFARNFLKLFSATLLAQAITILLSPVLTRLYSPEDFGVYALYMSIVSLLIVYATGRYEFAISVSKTHEESQTLFKLVFIITTISSALILLVVSLLKNPISAFIGFEKYPSLVYYIPLTIFSLGVMQGLSYYYNRQKNFSSMSSAKITQSLSTNISSIGFAWMGFHSLGMVWANILGISLANIFNLGRTKVYGLFIFKSGDLKIIKKLALKYKNYPLWNSSSAFFDILALQAPVLIFMRFFSEAIVGFYSLTVRVVGLPVSIISSAVSQVYLSEIAEKENKGEPIEHLIKKATKILSLIGFLPALFLVIFSPQIFVSIFGEEWLLAGELATILAFSYYAKFIVSPLSTIFFVKNRIKLLSLLQFSRALTTTALLILSSIFYENIIDVILYYVVHEVIFYLIYWFVILHISRKKRQSF